MDTQRNLIEIKRNLVEGYYILLYHVIWKILHFHLNYP